jgi:hypothetical protein
MHGRERWTAKTKKAYEGRVDHAPNGAAVPMRRLFKESSFALNGASVRKTIRGSWPNRDRAIRYSKGTLYPALPVKSQPPRWRGRPVDSSLPCNATPTDRPM